MNSLIICMALVLGGNPPEDVILDQVDIIELNHHYDGDGKLVFNQILYWDWDPNVKDFTICAWRMYTEGKTSNNIVPVYCHREKCYKSIFIDSNKLRKIRAREFRESWTQFDPELINRQIWDSKKRRELSYTLKTQPVINW